MPDASFSTHFPKKLRLTYMDLLSSQICNFHQNLKYLNKAWLHGVRMNDCRTSDSKRLSDVSIVDAKQLLKTFQTIRDKNSFTNMRKIMRNVAFRSSLKSNVKCYPSVIALSSLIQDQAQRPWAHKALFHTLANRLRSTFTTLKMRVVCFCE